jgi:hypothetical protein
MTTVRRSVLFLAFGLFAFPALGFDRIDVTVTAAGSSSITPS